MIRLTPNAVSSSLICRLKRLCRFGLPFAAFVIPPFSAIRQSVCNRSMDRPLRVSRVKDMLAAGNDCELIVNEGGKHGYLMFDKKLFDETLKRIEQFLREKKML